MTDYIIVFGAAVRPNGRPSAALRRRIDLAARWERDNPGAMVIATGGVGRHGPAEAKVIKDALVASGIAARRIILEPRARDTLESVRRCHRLLMERGDCERVICCTSSYHQPRCALLLRLLGYTVISPAISMSRSRLKRRVYSRLILKEVIATPYDAALLMLRRKVG